MGGGTAGMGSYPPINVFQRGDGFVAVIELPGIDKNDIEIEAKSSELTSSTWLVRGNHHLYPPVRER